MSEQKRLFNRFDEYEIAAMFSETAEDYCGKKLQAVRAKFYLKCVLGVLLAINGYLSHWGPWPWPSNFNLLVFSVVFYHLASWWYGRLEVIPKAEGSMIGEYILKEQRIVILLRIGENKQEYFIELLKNGSLLKKKVFNYVEYFIEDGTFLEDLFRKHLGGFIDEVSRTALSA